MLFSTDTAIATTRLGIDKGIKTLAEAGFPCLNLDISKHTEAIKCGEWRSIAKEYKQASEAYGIRYDLGHAPYGGGRFPDGRSVYVIEKSQLMPQALEFAKEAGVEIVTIHPLNFLETDFKQTREYHFEKNIEFYSRLTPIARNLGIRIGIENLWSTDNASGKIVGITCADPEEHIRYVKELGADDVFTACLDVGHSALTGIEPQDVIRALGKNVLGALHVHDVDYVRDLHTLPYMSKLNWDEICRALGEIDYSGVLTFEADSFLARFPSEVIPDAAKLMASVGKHLADKIDSYRIRKKS